ncbi:MAG: hypothetical protein H6Q33_2888 [Deltaproteobacteria bacterium]|jgi:hypothetical protein|nr:hypothetical protein [Deltaproteobacteria bacterium]
MTQSLRAVTLAGGVAILCGAAVLLLRPWAPNPEAQHVRPRAKTSDRVRIRLQQLRSDHPDWRENTESLRQPVAPPVEAPAAARGAAPASDIAPQRTRGEAHDARTGAPGGDAEVPGGEPEDDIPTLKKMALEDPDPDRRLAAITMLGATEDPEAPAILAQALSDQNEEVRLAALEALSDFTSEPPVDAIDDALRDPSPDIRFEALSVLADLGGERVRSAVERALTDPDEDVRALAEGILDLESSTAATSGQRQPPR